jgi:hypothetical protein
MLQIKRTKAIKKKEERDEDLLSYADPEVFFGVNVNKHSCKSSTNFSEKKKPELATKKMCFMKYKGRSSFLRLHVAVLRSLPSTSCNNESKRRHHGTTEQAASSRYTTHLYSVSARF